MLDFVGPTLVGGSLHDHGREAGSKRIHITPGNNAALFSESQQGGPDNEGAR
jgi:hypothetical protein